MKVPKAVADAYMIVDDIAFYKMPNTKRLSYKVVDLRNTKNVGQLVLNPVNNKFSLINSTFPNGKRKYEMLYYQERNREQLMGVQCHAQVF